MTRPPGRHSDRQALLHDRWKRTPADGELRARRPERVRNALAAFFVGLAFMLPVHSTDAGEFQNALSLQGFTGLLNTPNAEVTDEGAVATLFTNQKESQWRNRVSREDSYLFSVGLLPFFEVGGRLTDAPPDTRDLSANLKLKLPFSSLAAFLPDVAFGLQDAGGGSALLRTKYLVASDTWGRFRFSLGYGDGPDRMKGIFGGVEVRACDWLYLVGENDTRETNAGIRLLTPEIGGWPVKLQVTAKTSLDYRAGNMEYAIGLQIPLGREPGSRKAPAGAPADEGEGPAEEKAAVVPAGAPPGGSALQPRQVEEAEPAPGELETLRQKLVTGGFQNVRVGTDRDRLLLVVEYENSRYNHNELDGLGVAAGMIVDTVSPEFEMLQLVIRKKGLRVLQVSAPFADFRGFLHGRETGDALETDLEITRDVVVDKEIVFMDGDANPSWLKSELVVYPGLRTFVGTEVGNFDYLLSVKPDYYLNLWKGAVMNARWDIPVDWSENFNDGGAFRHNRKGSQFERLMFLQALNVAPGFMLNLGVGMILPETYGAINEALWSPGKGEHRFLLRQAYATSSDREALYQNSKAYLGAYRYYYGPLDLYLEGTAGQFLDNDRGFMLELKRFFGDTAFSVYYKNSRTSAGERVEVGGVQIAIPLTPRRDMKPYLVQVKGTDEWSYAQETKIAAAGEANSVDTSVGVVPRTAYNLEHIFLNRDRLSDDYLRSHLPRVREAYETYR